MRFTAAVLATVALALAGCGGDDEDSTPTPDSGASGATGADGLIGDTASIEDVDACLRSDGFVTNVSENELIGVESPVEKLDVVYEDLETGASIAVFEGAEDAEAEAEAADIALGVGDTTVAGNTVWGVDSAVDDPERLEVAVEGCVPGS